MLLTNSFLSVCCIQTSAMPEDRPCDRFCSACCQAFDRNRARDRNGTQVGDRWQAADRWCRQFVASPSGCSMSLTPGSPNTRKRFCHHAPVKHAWSTDSTRNEIPLCTRSSATRQLRRSCSPAAGGCRDLRLKTLATFLFICGWHYAASRLPHYRTAIAAGPIWAWVRHHSPDGSTIAI